MIRPINFIVGIPRSGTTLISYVFNSKNVNSYLERNVLVNCISDDEPSLSSLLCKDKMNLFLEDISFDKPVIIKEPEFTYYIPEILEWFPNSKICHVVRNGVCVADAYHRYISTTEIEDHKKAWGLDWCPTKSWAIEGYKRGIEDWNNTLCRVIENKHLIDNNRYMEFKYEDFVTNIQFVSDIGHFFNLNRESINRSKHLYKKLVSKEKVNVISSLTNDQTVYCAEYGKKMLSYYCYHDWKIVNEFNDYYSKQMPRWKSPINFKDNE